jgi:hypothetical protein
MSPLVARAASVALSLALLLAPGRAAPFERDLPAALAEAHFSHLYAFNLVAAYESSHRGTRATFVVARRVSGDRSELLMQFRAFELGSSARNRAPLVETRFAKSFAGLLIHNRGRSDDLMVYVPMTMRVRRLPAIELQRQPVFRIFPLGEFRPIVSGELRYRFLSRDPAALAVEGRPVEDSPSFDRVELYFERGAPLAVRTVFFLRGKELRRVLIDPDDVQAYQGRLLPKLTRIATPDGEVTELRLRNVLVDPLLPEEIFSEHNLWVQRFPHF